MKRLLTTCFLLWMAGAAMAGPLADGLAAANRGD